MFPVSQRKQILTVFTFQAMIHVLQYFIFQSRLPRISKQTTHHYIPAPQVHQASPLFSLHLISPKKKHTQLHLHLFKNSSGLILLGTVDLFQICYIVPLVMIMIHPIQIVIRFQFDFLIIPRLNFFHLSQFWFLQRSRFIDRFPLNFLSCFIISKVIIKLFVISICFECQY